jgi:hypothetical protein
MKKCPACKKEVMEHFDTCFHCGQVLKVEGYSTFSQRIYEDSATSFAVYILLVFVAIFFPLLGILLGLLMAKNLKGFSRVLVFLGMMMFVFRVIGVAVFVLLLGM